MAAAAPTAPEFLEEFGTRAEHFQDFAILFGGPGSFAKCFLSLWQDPLPSQDATSVPRRNRETLPSCKTGLHCSGGWNVEDQCRQPNRSWIIKSYVPCLGETLGIAGLCCQNA